MRADRPLWRLPRLLRPRPVRLLGLPRPIPGATAAGRPLLLGDHHLGQEQEERGDRRLREAANEGPGALTDLTASNKENLNQHPSKGGKFFTCRISPHETPCGCQAYYFIFNASVRARLFRGGKHDEHVHIDGALVTKNVEFSSTTEI